MTTQAPRFTFTDDGAGKRLTVIDSKTGLEFTAQPVTDDEVTHQEAIDACAACRVGGHDDWALPTREQLLSLIDLTRYHPAIDTDAFPSITGGWFWSSDLCAWSSASAWFVYFYDGYVDYDNRDLNGGFALAVRRAGQ